MKILATYVASTNTQVHSGKCYFIGLISCYDSAVNDIESGGTAGTGNQKGYIKASGPGYILPKPGVEMSNGLYVAAEGPTIVYWAL